MALTKRVYTDGETIITAQNLNDIQDEIILHGNTLVPKTRTVNGKALSSNLTLNASDIPNDSFISGAKVDDALETLGSSTAIIENGNTATHNITIRQFVLWKGALYIASSSISSGDTLSSSNLRSITSGGLNELQSRLENMYVSAYDAYYSVSDLATYMSGRKTGDIVIARIASTAASAFFENGSAKPAICFLLKAGSTNTYFMAVQQDNVSIGNLSTSTSTITLLQDLAINNNVLSLNDSITYPAYLTCGIWRTGSDGTINLNFPATSLREGTTYTTTSTISVNMFLPGSADAATQLLNKSIADVVRITTDYIDLQLAAETGIPVNRMGFFSTRTAMTITAS